jgi:2'-phosphotransferase
MNKFKSLGLTFAELKRIVVENDKQRYKLLPVFPSAEEESEDPADYLIRANQGHSVAVAVELEPLLPESPDFPEKIVHGTFYAFYPRIVESGGLKCMGRTHIHLSPLAAYQEFSEKGAGKDGKEGALSGMRRDADVVFVVDARKAAVEGGCRFWRSENGVVLTEGREGVLAMEFVERVEDRRGLGTLWEAGKVVKELPEHLKNRMPPRGKEHVGREGGRRGGGNAGGKGKKGKGGREEVAEVKIDAGDS